ncbi:MAG TPA: HNH endonuclease [Thermoanaerobaculia bacterium]|nr:HNH endonuclease [Thermoanaerobaculia bacterium]
MTDLYGRRCAITQEKALPVLDASHILPVSAGGRHETSNGLLLRTDVHRLFERGYVTVTPDYRFQVSRRLKTDFDNGEPYYPFHGLEIRRPQRTDDQPDPRWLEWHADTIFLR